MAPDSRTSNKAGPSKIFQYGLTAFCVFVWSCIDYPLSVFLFLGMTLWSMRKPDLPNEILDLPNETNRGRAEDPSQIGKTEFDRWLLMVANLQKPLAETQGCQVKPKSRDVQP